MKRLVLFRVLLSMGAARMAQAEEIKLGYVDLQRALEETEDGRKARASLKKDFDAKQKELDERQDELKKSIDDLDKKRTLLSTDLQRSKEAEIQKKMQEAQQILMRHQQELAGKEASALQPIVDRMQRIIFKMSQAENFTMVFDKKQSGVVFAKPHLDLTNELIRRFNGGEEAGKSGPPKGQATPAAPAKKK